MDGNLHIIFETFGVTKSKESFETLTPIIVSVYTCTESFSRDPIAAKLYLGTSIGNDFVRIIIILMINRRNRFYTIDQSRILDNDFLL